MDIFQYRKFFIYALTFLAYAWSGYGAGLLQNLRDAVLTAETVFTDLLENAVTVAHKIKDIHEVFDAAVEEHCDFQCPSGASPKADWNHKPQSNGCGSLGFEVCTRRIAALNRKILGLTIFSRLMLQIDQQYLPLEEMTKCCNAHDICYDTCNQDKDKCDLEFKRCLYRYCDGYQQSAAAIVNACKAAAKLLHTGTTALGCKSYLDAQRQACYCPSAGGAKKNNDNNDKKSRKAGGEL
ncbi:unnamed protein product [Trichogramma brassicae]|uniref:Group XIIA secretory phospholipase A2 n=1 Tax=Trichogramma brassicae TaxID=86971 RepID=A0A6H5J6F8_9HYME|nr:unnamed protein product [Trichogramma brassicae]